MPSVISYDSAFDQKSLQIYRIVSLIACFRMGLARALSRLYIQSTDALPSSTSATYKMYYFIRRCPRNCRA